MSLRKLIRNILLEKINPDKLDYGDSVGGTHGFHGAGMNNNNLKYQSKQLPGPQFEKSGPITDGEIRHALNYLNKYKPTELVVYSRGSAVWAAAQDKAGTSDEYKELPDSLNKITYLAPAAKRPDWGQQSNAIDTLGDDEVIASVSDGRVPLAQAAKIATEIGGDLTIYKPSRMKNYSMKDDANTYGLKGHQQPMHWKDGEGKKFAAGSAEIKKIANEFPDWEGAKYATYDELQKQETEALELMEIRKLIRSLLLEKKKVKCPLKNGKRDYKCEYRKYGGASKKGKKDRAARNQARKVAKREGRVKKGDGKEIDHKKPLSKGGSNAKSNQRVVSRATNRKKGNK